MIVMGIPHVLRRGRSFRYRRVVPPDCREKIGRRNWIKTWKAGTPIATVEREAKALAAKHDHEIAVARGQEVSPEAVEARARKLIAGDPVDKHDYLGIASSEDMSPQTAAVVRAIESGGRFVPETMQITEAMERDVKMYGAGRDPKPLAYAVASFIAVIADKDVTAITRADVSDWIAAQSKLAPATVLRRLGALRALVNRFYLDMEIDRRNPFEKHRVNNGSGAASDRLPFNTAMLKRIDGYLSSNRPGHETKNILRMMRCTGAGPAEVGGLVLADVSLDSEVPYVWIRQNSLRGIKTSVRDRQVPLIGQALNAAKDAVKRAQGRARGKSRDDVALFAGFKSNRGADSLSAKLNKAIRSSGVPRSPRLVAYSYRHTLKEALRSAGVADHIQRRALGHAGHGVADRYGSPRARLSEARAALVAAMEHLGAIDDSVYSDTERLD